VEIVEIDGTGRIYIPAEIRKRIKAKRFKLRLVEGGILLEPIDDIDIYYGRFGPAKYSTVEEIERALEDAVQV
jgi:bifunctional DNA-binding transcriptional regulator/antitoxin component of YhaV-PrlF toxin-antitoxin module